MINARTTPLLTVYLEKRADLERFFTSRLKSRAAAEDLVQEIYEKIAKLNEEELVTSPVAYLYRLGANLMLDNIRYDRRRIQRDQAWLESRRLSAGEQRAEDPPADEALAARQRLRLVLKAIDDLPPQAKRAFQLHKLEGLSHAETARLMGISKSGVEKHISFALKFLLKRVP